MPDLTAYAVAVDSRRVVHETIDGEVILIQLETGYYYSLAGAGAEIWALLVKGVEPEEIARRVGATHGANADAAVLGLVHDLHAESLLVLHGEDLAGAALAAPSDGLAKPQLQKYTDMEDFMLCDPVHDVGDAGWPSRKAAG